MQNDVPYIAHEAGLARMERLNKRLWIALLTLAAINAGWWILFQKR